MERRTCLGQELIDQLHRLGARFIVTAPDKFDLESPVKLSHDQEIALHRCKGDILFHLLSDGDDSAIKATQAKWNWR